VNSSFKTERSVSEGMKRKS